MELRRAGSPRQGGITHFSLPNSALVSQHVQDTPEVTDCAGAFGGRPFSLFLQGRKNEALGPPGWGSATQGWKASQNKERAFSQPQRAARTKVGPKHRARAGFLPLPQERVFGSTLVSKQKEKRKRERKKYRKSSLETLACLQAGNSADTLSRPSLIA